MQQFIGPVIYFTLLLFGTSLYANTDDEIARILAGTQAPPGVVIEIVTGDEDALDETMPRVQSYVDRLRARFVDLPIAVVSHGNEQFALMDERRAEHEKVHDLVQDLANAEVPVHVCGTYAGWHGFAPEDFPAHVDVAVTGPAQISQYEELGYLLIQMD